MKASRVVLILISIFAAGLAAYLATRGSGNPRPAQQVATTAPKPMPQAKVLVAKTDIGVGDRLTPQDVEWRDWPQDGVSGQYITIASMPDAPDQLKGAIARSEIMPGDPIRDDKLAKSGEGYLSAILDKGMRAVSVSVSAESGSGGFIVPNDHVDVVSTHSAPGGGQVSEVVLANVRVLAIGKQLGDDSGKGGTDKSTSKGFTNSTIATVELDPARAQTLINASQSGKLTLVLRSVADFSDTDQSVAQAPSQAIKVIRYGQASSVQAGGAQNYAEASVDSASYSPPVSVVEPSSQSADSAPQPPTAQ